jgi:phage tail-like protein
MPFGPNAVAMYAKNKLEIRNDPFLSCRFLLEIEGMIVGGFTEIEGLEITTQVETIREGGMNHIEYKLPKMTTYRDLVLKYGVSSVDLLWGWYRDVIRGEIKRKNGTIYLLGSDGLPAVWWDFLHAWPVAWHGPNFDASANTVATQSMTLSHQGLGQTRLSQAY